MLLDSILRKYVGKEDFVSINRSRKPPAVTDPFQAMLMEVDLDVAAARPVDNSHYDGGSTKKTDTSKAAETFLEEFPTAKIVVIIDSHCLENGFFVWNGDTKSSYQACPLLAVRL